MLQCTQVFELRDKDAGALSPWCVYIYITHPSYIAFGSSASEGEDVLLLAFIALSSCALKRSIVCSLAFISLSSFALKSGVLE